MNPDYKAIHLRGAGNRRYSIDDQFGPSGTQVHWHDCIEVIYMVCGSAEIYFGNRWNRLLAGDLILLPPGRVHCTRCEDPEAEKIVVGFAEALIADDPADMALLLPLRNARIGENCIFRDISETPAGRGLERLKHIDQSGPAAGLESRGELLRIYGWFYEQWHRAGLVRPGLNQSARVLELQRRLEETYREPPTAQEMAGELGISYSYLGRLLRESLHMSYCELVHLTRVEQAKKLLLTTERNVTEIGLDCGFCDTAYFIKIFRRFTGETPRQFRMLRNGE